MSINHRQPSVSLHYLNIIQNTLIRMKTPSTMLEELLKNKKEEEFYFDRAPLKILIDTWAEAEHLTNDPIIGLHVGQNIHPMDYGLLGQLIMNSPTISEAVYNAFKVEFIINNLFPTEIVIDGNKAINRIYCHQYNAETIRHIAEQDISGIINIALFVMNKDYSENNHPIEVHFRHKAAAPLEDYQIALGTKVKFEQEYNQVIYPIEILSTPTYNPNKRIEEFIQGELESLMQQVDQHDHMALRLWRAFQKSPRPNEVNIDTAAKIFNITARTLQRHLKNEGTSFQEELTYFKSEKSKQLLNNRNTSITNIAHSLGFNDSSAFHKAFKRWTGITPAEYRQKLKSSILH